MDLSTISFPGVIM